jgi:hypothetical protein
VKGAILWTTACPLFSNSLARAGWQGIRGFLCLSNTKTCMVAPQKLTLHWSCDRNALLAKRLPSGMSGTGSHLAVSVKTFGALPFARMILTFQNPGLRKHPGVGLDDL